MMRISDIKARQILDSRGNPTVEADVWVDGKFAGRAAVPSGASTGEHEAHELRDGDEAYHGRGVEQAVENIHLQILPVLQNLPIDEQALLDREMIMLDGSRNKSRLGANAILAVSLACAHAAAQVRGVLLYSHINDTINHPVKSLPVPMMNVLNGGAHAINSADFQEFMIVPLSAKSYAEATRIGSEVFHELKQIIQEKGGSTAVGDEGGFTYPVKKNQQMLDILMQGIEKAGYTPGQDVGIALDIAASEFFNDGSYELAAEKRKLPGSEMIDFIGQLAKKYPLVSVEDGLDENDWDGWQQLVNKLGDKLQLVGDDLLVTNPERLQKAIELKAANSILIKPNQIGTLTETLEAIKLAQENNFTTIVSHRSGETEDVTIAHIAVGSGAGQIKTGSLSRSDRTAKHNELMRIEQADDSLQMAKPINLQERP